MTHVDSDRLGFFWTARIKIRRIDLVGKEDVNDELDAWLKS